MTVIKSKRARDILRISAVAAMIPAALVASRGSFAFGAIAVAFLSVILFFCGFETRTTGTRRLVAASILIALAVVGRFIPFFKPVTAIAVIGAVYLGAECGFLIGSVSALLSNFFFGQGPWTPFQMIAWGLIGLLAGVLASPLRRSRIALALYGAFAGIVFSLTMDVWTVVWYAGRFDFPMYTAAILTALPFTLLYAASNVAFLLILAKPFGDKLQRVKIKYGI